MLRVIVTAGGTREPIDDVRVVANTSTGRFGAAIARALAWRGVEVVLIGADGMATDGLPATVRRVGYRSTDDLAHALDRELRTPPDAVLMAAAVSDYRPIPHAGKIRSDADRLLVELERTPKLLPTLRARCPRAVLVGFKLLSQVSSRELVDTARRQVELAALDLTVANDLAELTEGRHPVWLVDRDGEARVEGLREEVAEAVADAVLARCGAPAMPDGPWTSVPGPVRGRARAWWRVPDGIADGPAYADVATALAVRRSAPVEPLVVPLQAGGLAVGLAPLDAAAIAAAWAATPALSDHDASLWWRGVPVARARWDGDVLHLQPTGLGEDELWSQVVLPPLAPARVVAPEAVVEDLRLAGFRPIDARVDGGARVTLVPPWLRPEVLPAASACLLDVATRRVLIGRRLVTASHGRLAFPGGKGEPGETAEATARRELIEEAGLRAPGGPAWHVRTVWRGDAPGFAIACHVWRVVGTEPPVPSDELDPHWRELDEVAADPEALPGVRLVLDDLRERLETT